MLSKISIIMMVGYPLVAYIALLLEQSLFIISYFLLAIFFIALDKCRHSHWYTGALLLSGIALTIYLVSQSYHQYILYLPPIFILLGMFVLFTQSLIAGQTPIVTRYASLIGDKQEEKHLRYYRMLTSIWSVFFLFMASTSILLAIYTDSDTWSLFTHVISYFLIGGFFIIEFIYRKYHFAGEIEGGFFQFIGKIIKIRPHSLSND